MKRAAERLKSAAARRFGPAHSGPTADPKPKAKAKPNSVRGGANLIDSTNEHLLAEQRQRLIIGQEREQRDLDDERFTSELSEEEDVEDQEEEEEEDDGFYNSDELETNLSANDDGDDEDDDAQQASGGPRRAPKTAREQLATPSSNNTHYNTVNDSWFINYNGIIVILPIIFNAFQDEQLERAYQRYSHGQRQKSLIIAHTIDLLLKVALLSVPLVYLAHRLPSSSSSSSLPTATATADATFANKSETIYANLNESLQEAGLDSDNIPSNLFADKWLPFRPDSLVFDDISSHHNKSPEQQQLYDHQQLIQLSETLIFGPLTRAIRIFKADDGRPAPTDTDHSALASSFSFDVAAKRLFQFRQILLVENIYSYQLAFLFSSLNLFIILVCICVPHRYLTDRLSFIALFTWFLMCLQNYLIYNQNETDKQTTISNLQSSWSSSSPSSLSFTSQVDGPKLTNNSNLFSPMVSIMEANKTHFAPSNLLSCCKIRCELKGCACSLTEPSPGRFEALWNRIPYSSHRIQLHQQAGSRARASELVSSLANFCKFSKIKVINSDN